MIEQTSFNNRYRLESKLGEGGMATVYCGTDTVLRRRVAIKVLREQYAADDEFVQRFYQEAESAAKLSHPNIVNTYDVGREGSVYYIVMELVDGPSLAEIIATDGTLPEPVAIDYAAQICNGLAYAHRQGLLHRDIKPANILVTKDDVVKLSDFGIARAVSAQTMALTKPGLVMGSVYYISPEQAQGHDLHESSDLYSVGVVLYQMLTGKLPFTGESPVTVALKHIGDPVPTIDMQATSPAMAAIVNRLLQKHPANRFQSASEVASALREARERPSIAAYAISDDAPTTTLRAQQLPPRRSPMPDRSYTSISEDEERSARGSMRIAAIFAVLLVAAAIAGYLIFGREIPSIVAAGAVVGNYEGMNDVDARKAIENAGLVVKEKKTSSDTAPMNQVISQSPAANSRVDPKSTVDLVVSNGLPVIGLRDVTNFVVGDAIRILNSDKFKVAVVRRHDAAPKDTVLMEQPKPASSVRQGSTIRLVVSDGPAPEHLPQLVGLTVDQAETLAQRFGFSLDASQRAPSPQYSPGIIASQDVAVGTVVNRDANTTVHVTVSTGQPVVENLGGSGAVPDVTGKTLAEAMESLQDAGFQPALTYTIQSPGAANNGTVLSENPAAQSSLARGSTVTLDLAVPGAIPDTQGMTQQQALSTLAAAGYQVSSIVPTAQGAGGRVVGTQPEVGTQLAPGTSVVLVVNGIAH